MRYVVWLLAGFLLYRLSGVLEGMGDAAPYAASGISEERLKFHVAALGMLLAGLACFVRALVLAWRAIRGGGASTSKPPKTSEEAEAFDADAALARYLDRNRERPAPPPGSFGRKGR